MAEESKHDALLKRAQIILAILTALVGLIVGVYNVKKNVFSSTTPGEIQVSVRGDNRQSIAGARIELYSPQNALLASSQTNSDGNYSRKDLDPGNYLLKVTHPAFEQQMATIQVNPKKVSEFDMTLQSARAANSGNQIKSALEEVGATWIKTIGKPKTQDPEQK